MTRAKKKKQIRNVGVVTAVVLLLAGLYYYTDGFSFHKKQDSYYGMFPNVAGLDIGTPVQVKGVTVGHVAEMGLNEGDGIKIEFAIDKELKLPKGSIVWLEPGGINGGQGILITLGAGPGILPVGSVLETRRDTGFIDNLNYKSGVYLRSGRAMLTVFDTTIKKFNYILNSGLLHDILNGVYYLNKQTGKFEALSGDLKGYSITIDNGLLRIDSGSRNLAAKNEDINKAIRNADTTMEGLANKHYKEDFDTLRDNIKSIAATIHKFKENKLVNDKTAYNKANASVDSTHKSLKDIKEHPSAHWMAIFGKNKKKE